jgi:hypothetical protein
MVRRMEIAFTEDEVQRLFSRFPKGLTGTGLVL